MTPEICAACSPGEVRVAVRGPAGLLDYAIWRPGQPDGVGDLHRGRVIARAPAMAGAFVQLAGLEGFLPDSSGGAGATAGAMLGVRVVRAAQGGKGPRLTAELTQAEHGLAADGPVRLLRRGAGALERLAALYPDAAILIDDAAVAGLVGAASALRIGVVEMAFTEDVADEVAALEEPRATLPGGATLHITPTPALTALDVDLGSGTASRAGKAAAQLSANAVLLPEIARQIRLRNLAGAIVLDLGGMPARRRGALGPQLAAALADDPLKPRFLGFTALGFAEIVRARVHPPLHELLAGPSADALAALRHAERHLRARPGPAPSLVVAPSLLAVLERDDAALGDFARRTGHRLRLSADPALERPAGAQALRPWRCA